MVDRIKPLKLESSDSGGTEDDTFPTSADANEDYIDTRGISLQNDSSDDETVAVSRDASNNLTFKDGVVSGTKTLTELLAAGSGVSEETHKALRQLIHFINDGPAEGFVSGAYKEILPAGNPFPTSRIWYESSAKAQKIVEKIITRNNAQMPTQEQWKMYDTDGTTVLVTVTDTITYVNNVFESTRTRSIV